VSKEKMSYTRARGSF